MLDRAAVRLSHGASRLYQHWLIRHLHASYRRKFSHRNDAPVAFDELKRLNTFFLFDHHITAPLHGFSGVDDYYARSSSRPWLGRIETPTLLLQAADDPFMSGDLLPTPAELSTKTQFELTPYGGHVGFIARRERGGREYWAEGRIARFLEHRLGC